MLIPHFPPTAQADYEHCGLGLTHISISAEAMLAGNTHSAPSPAWYSPE